MRRYFLNKYSLFLYLVPPFLVSCTTATIRSAGEFVRESRPSEYVFRGCEVNGGTQVQQCDEAVMDNLRRCSDFQAQLVSRPTALKMHRELKYTGSVLGWTPLSVFSLGIIPTYTTVAVERVKVTEVSSGAEVAKWDNYLQVQGGWFFVLKQAFSGTDPNDYCQQFKQEILSR